MEANLDILNIAGSALTSERLRMDVISSNIANVNTTHDDFGNYSPYRRKVVSFKTALDSQSSQVSGVTVASIDEDESQLKAIFDPSHPEADGNGYVYYPNVSIEKEMVDMISAKASYEANVTSIQTYKAIYNASLGI